MKLKIQKHAHNVPVLHTDDLTLFNAIRSHFLTLKHENSILPYVLTGITALKAVLEKLKQYAPSVGQKGHEDMERIKALNKMIQLADNNASDIILFYFESDLIDMNTPGFN